MAGTVQDPIVVKSFGDEQYVGCTGYPADSHVTIWLTVSPLYSTLQDSL
jgi:cytochrome c oxidase subunit 5b